MRIQDLLMTVTSLSGSPYFAPALLLVVGVPSGVDAAVSGISKVKFLDFAREQQSS